MFIINPDKSLEINKQIRTNCKQYTISIHIHKIDIVINIEWYKCYEYQYSAVYNLIYLKYDLKYNNMYFKYIEIY